MIENEEDWFYESISKYKILNMFELEHPIHHLELTACNSICISCSNKKRNQLLELALPLKLTSQSNGSTEMIITNDTDLKIKCGKFTNATIAHMKANCYEPKLITTHENNQDVTVHTLSSNYTDEMKEELVIKSELKGSSLDLNNSELVLTKDNISPTFLVDMNTGQMVNKIHPKELSKCLETVTPSYFEPTLISLCHKSSGKVQFYDSRSSKFTDDLSGSSEGNTDFWAFSTFYKISDKNSTNSLIAMVSNKGSLKLYDLRNLKVPYFSGNLGITTSNTSLQLQLKQKNECWISMSGFDGNVYVYQLLSEPKLTFVHDGHRHVEGFSSHTITTGHFWFPHIDNLIISCASNGTIQSWQFEEQICKPLI